MRVRLFGLLRVAVGQASVMLPVAEGDTVRTVLARLVERYPKARSEVYERPGVPVPYLMIAVNGRDVRDGPGLSQPVGPQDEMAVFPPSAGG